MDQIKPIPRNPLLGALADFLSKAKEKTGVAGDVLLGEIPQALDDWSYGQRMTKGSGWTLQAKPGTVDLALAAIPTATKLAPVVPKAMAKGLQNLETAQRIPQASQRGAIVWHGSPYKFDKFDSSKIGTGEGAQAYGHGLYLAESPNVAKSYADSVSRLHGATTTVEGAGRKVPVPLWAADRVKSEGIDSLIDEWAKRLAESQARAKTSLQPWIDQGNAVRFAQQLDELKAIRAGGSVNVEAPGSLYKVNLPDPMIARMLDWDQPLSGTVKRHLARDAESRGVASRREALEALLDYDYPRHAFEAAVGPEQAQLAEALRRRGIPGVKYFDQNSRVEGAGTRNFVVFPGEENALRILERNGRPLP